MKLALRVLLAAIALTSGTIWAQTEAATGVIAGVITDQGGAVLSGAVLHLTNTNTGYKRAATSNDRNSSRTPVDSAGHFLADRLLYVG